MGNSTEIRVGDKIIEIKELSVGEVRKWMKLEVDFEESIQKVEDKDNIDLIGEWLIDGLPFRVVTLMTNINEEDLNNMMPSDIGNIVEKCKEVNPYFFGLRNRIVGVAEKILRQP